MSVRLRINDVVPVKRTHLIIKERRLPNFVALHYIQIDPILGRHELPPATRPPTVHAPQELRYKLSVITNHLLHNAVLATELKLVAEIRQLTLRQGLCRNESPRSGRVGCRNTEDRCDEFGVPLRNAVDGRTAPVVAAEDELGRVGVACNGGDGVGVGAEAVVVQIWGEALRSCMSLREYNNTGARMHRSYSFAVAHTINRDGSVSQLDEMGDLVAPAERIVWEAMDENDRALRFAFREGFEIVFIVGLSAENHDLSGCLIIL
jgi:hypothetical protein